jgi:hypothetical protein
MKYLGVVFIDGKALYTLNKKYIGLNYYKLI